MISQARKCATRLNDLRMQVQEVATDLPDEQAFHYPQEDLYAIVQHMERLVRRIEAADSALNRQVANVG